MEKQEVTTTLREFIQEFEHSTGRMCEMLYGTSDDPDNNPEFMQVLDWFDLIYRYSTFGIISYWIDDKTEEHSMAISINPATGERREKWTSKEMKVPRKYRRAAKTL